MEDNRMKQLPQNNKTLGMLEEYVLMSRDTGKWNNIGNRFTFEVDGIGNYELTQLAYESMMNKFTTNERQIYDWLLCNLVDNSWNIDNFVDYSDHDKLKLRFHVSDYNVDFGFDDDKHWKKKLQKLELKLKKFKEISVTMPRTRIDMGNEYISHVTGRHRKRFHLKGWTNGEIDQFIEDNTRTIHTSSSMIIEYHIDWKTGNIEIDLGSWILSGTGDRDNYSYLKLPQEIFHINTNSGDNMRYEIVVKLLRLYELRERKNQAQHGIYISTLFEGLGIDKDMFVGNNASRYKKYLWNALEHIQEHMRYTTNMSELKKLRGSKLWDGKLEYQSDIYRISNK